MQHNNAIKCVRTVESWLTRVFTTWRHDGHATLDECGPTGVLTTIAKLPNKTKKKPLVLI